MFPLEVPVFSPHSASLALAQHASRVELNRDGSYPEGGLTPTIADLQSLTTSHKDVSSPPQAAVRVMIRPRGPPPPQSPPAPDFLYSEAEFEEMKKAVGDFKASGCINVERGDGFVFGCLKEGKMGGNGGKGSVVVVDIARNTELVELAKPFPAVFHRAFDDILGSKGFSVDEALQDLASCGFHGLLTSGGPGSAVDNPSVVSQIISAAPGKLREVIIGGGVRSTNVEELRGLFAVPEGVEVWFHSSCLTRTGDGDVVDEGEVRAIVKGLA